MSSNRQILPVALRFVGSLLATLFLFELTIPVVARAAGSINAEAQLGQYTGGSPTFAQGTINSGGSLGPVGFSDAQDVVTDDVRHLMFVAEYQNSRVVVHQLNESNRPVDGSAEYVLGQASFTAVSSSTNASTLIAPQGLAFDPATKYLYVSDASQDRILVFNTTTITSGMAATFVIGQADFSGSASGTAANRFKQPQGLKLDPVHNRLFVADDNNNRVMVFDITTVGMGMSATNVLGQSTFNTLVVGTSSTSMDGPEYLDYDPESKLLFVADHANNRVLVFETAIITNGMPAKYVLGQANMDSKTAALTATGFSNPVGVAVDTAGKRLWVSDASNDRLLLFDISTITNGQAAIGIIGQPDFTTNISEPPASHSIDSMENITYSAAFNQLILVDSGYNRILFFPTTPIEVNGLKVTLNVRPVLSFAVSGAGSCNGLAATTNTGSTGSSVDLQPSNVGDASVAAQQLQVTSNASAGFVVSIRSNSPLSRSSGGNIPDLALPNASPGTFTSGATGAVGYTTNAFTRFTSPSPQWAGLTRNGEPVASATGPGAITTCVGYQVQSGTNTAAGDYTTNITYTLVPSF